MSSLPEPVGPSIKVGSMRAELDELPDMLDVRAGTDEGVGLALAGASGAECLGGWPLCLGLAHLFESEYIRGADARR